MNKAELLGRLTKDPEISYSQGEKQTCIARFTIAVTRKFKRDEADFIKCICFGKTAEFIEKYVKKGSQVCVAGRIQTGKYTNREGVTVYTTEVVVEDLDLCSGNGRGKTQEQTDQKTQVANDGFLTIPEGIENETPFLT